MKLSLGDVWPLLHFEVIKYSGTDPEMIASVDAFNFWFSITMEFGLAAFLFTLVVATLARS